MKVRTTALNFCQGTVTEMLDDPGEEIFDIIRYFGSREKIFNVHFRNIRGHKLDFMEVFPDEGSIDMFECIKVYQEVGLQVHGDAGPCSADRWGRWARCRVRVRIRLYHGVVAGNRRTAQSGLGY